MEPIREKNNNFKLELREIPKLHLSVLQQYVPPPTPAIICVFTSIHDEEQLLEINSTPPATA